MDVCRCSRRVQCRRLHIEFALFTGLATVYPGFMVNSSISPAAFLVLSAIGFLAGCGGEVPGFLGREGDGSSSYNFEPTVVLDPVPMPVRTVRADRGPEGVIVLAEAISPTQGYHTATLLPQDQGGLDSGGYLNFLFLAIPPGTAASVGPEQTRILRGASYVPTRALRNVRGVRINGASNAVTATVR